MLCISKNKTFDFALIDTLYRKMFNDRLFWYEYFFVEARVLIISSAIQFGFADSSAD